MIASFSVASLARQAQRYYRSSAIEWECDLFCHMHAMGESTMMARNGVADALGRAGEYAA
jgi:hypothetical protein